MKKIALFFIAFIFFNAYTFAQEVTIIIKQEDSPIRITKYEAEYRTANKLHIEGIKHELHYWNTSQKNIVAIQFGFVSFNVWNELLSKKSGLSIENLESNEKENSSWIFNPRMSFSFYTGVTYVSKVRFEDGQFWDANFEEIGTEIKKNQVDFNISNLEMEETEE